MTSPVQPACLGVLPGIGPLATIAMLLPITFNLPAVSALIMLAGIYYGCQYGGSTTAILVKLLGESASVVHASTATRWPRRAGRGLHWPLRQSAPSLRVPSEPS